MDLPSNCRRDEEEDPPNENEKGSSRPRVESMSGRGMDKEVVTPNTNGP